MSYLYGVQEAPDWVLICAEQQELPCHSAQLTKLSSFWEGLRETQPREDGKVAVPFHLEGFGPMDRGLGVLFLQWVYNRKKIQPSVEQARTLAHLGLLWDTPGIAECCDTVLARAAASDDLLMCERPNQYSASSFDVLDWAKLAVACDMQALLVQCEYYIIGHFDKVATDIRLKDLSSESLTRILLGVYTTASQDTYGIVCPCCLSDNVELKTKKSNSGRTTYDVIECLDCGHDCRDLQPENSQISSKYLRPPTVADIEGWALAMQRTHDEKTYYSMKHHFRLPRRNKARKGRR